MHLNCRHVAHASASIPTFCNLKNVIHTFHHHRVCCSAENSVHDKTWTAHQDMLQYNHNKFYRHTSPTFAAIFGWRCVSWLAFDWNKPSEKMTHRLLQSANWQHPSSNVIVSWFSSSIQVRCGPVLSNSVSRHITHQSMLMLMKTSPWQLSHGSSTDVHKSPGSPG